MNSDPVRVAVVMGSKSDFTTMNHAVFTLQQLQICHTVMVVSAHRTPDKLYGFAKSAQQNGFEVIIAGAGGAAHLPGMVASMTCVPVIGVPIKSEHLNGLDSLFSIVQMPKGTPVATMAIGPAGAVNAAVMAASILGLHDTSIVERLRKWKQALSTSADQLEAATEGANLQQKSTAPSEIE